MILILTEDTPVIPDNIQSYTESILKYAKLYREPIT